MATHSSTLAWKTPWTEELGRLQSMELQSLTQLSNFTFFLSLCSTRGKRRYNLFARHILTLKTHYRVGASKHYLISLTQGA